jgi:putative hemolysin
MISSALFWLLLNLITILILAFYSMLEMACVSFNKVRLQYYVFKGNKQAIWLNWLLNNPTRLFGTTLLGVNVATVFGSEFAREFFSSIGLDPDLSPFTQVLLVVIFGELAPMFAARRYAEHVTMLGVPIVYASAKLMSPIIWAISAISKAFNKMIGGKETHGNIFITQEELLKILEEQDETGGDGEDFNTVTTNIFNLRQKDLRQVMEPLESVSKISSNVTVAQIANVLQNQKSDQNYVLIYHREPTNIIGVVQARHLIRAPENRRVRDFAQPPWFVTQNTSLLKILNQFRRNNEAIGIILNEQGKAEGVIHLDDIVEEIFGIRTVANESGNMLFLERTFPGSMKVGDFNSQFDVVLDKRKDLTLSDLILEHLGHHPEVGESIFIDPFELTVEVTSLLEIKTVKITTKNK